jgi:hypothetical protein
MESRSLESICTTVPARPTCKRNSGGLTCSARPSDAHVGSNVPHASTAAQVPASLLSSQILNVPMKTLP